MAPEKFTEVSYQGVDFEHSDKEKLKAMAVGQACDNANRRKQAFEERLGLRLSPRRFLDNQLPPSRLLTGLQGGTVPSFGVTSLPGREVAATEAVASQPESTFGELIFRARVTIEYAVEKK